MRINSYCLLFLAFSLNGLHAQVLNGKVLDASTNEPVIGANIVIKGTVNGTTTDINGTFSLNTKGVQLPFAVEVSFIGYRKETMEVTDLRSGITVKLSEDKEMLGEVSVIEQRLSQKQRESALTVEALDNLAIKETPAANFYEALGNLKGVDLTSASIGFKIINTRGFNSTSPVRSLQIIDGVDNQAPGLNFSLGNFLGASELDVQNVDIIAGASTAFYGPGAFNGVISMTTKNPFDYQGISASVKIGERALTETAVRYAEAFKAFDRDYDNVAFKINLFYLTANDWEATNYDPVDDSPVGRDNPGRYDAINVYGDEDLTGGNDFNNVNNVLDQPTSYAGLGIFYRPGYREEDIVDYNSRNLKTNLGAFFRLTEEIELSYNFNYGTGTTVYQGENRFSLKDIQFYQHVVELEKKDHFFIKAYKTQEDAGNSYDAVLTAFKMNETVAPSAEWYRQYTALWRNKPPQGYGMGNKFLAIAGYPDTANGQSIDEWFTTDYQDTLAKYNNLLTMWHDSVLDVINEFSFPTVEAGSPEYDSLLNYVTSRTFTEGGSRFYDRSALYHIMGEYQFNPSWATVKVGGNYRLYLPDSRGNIFDELVFTPGIDSNGLPTTDTSFRKIRNSEFGAYVGLEKKFLGEQFITNLTIRMDKNQNFDYLFSPAVSVVYNIDSRNTLRASFGSAIRNPTLQ
ncbi:MAG TPA: TonB-dependent receptor, partial [Cryomorphaceae bacterium]|nr:TonB-dependent receptor [Cryomorphaceae bacterium]